MPLTSSHPCSLSSFLTRLISLLYHATVILLCRPYRSQQPWARRKATSAAEMIDRLIILHIRRFGFRIFTYLESYATFVASTINILDLKDGTDKEGASARLALNLEVLRNATGTPSSTGCVSSSPCIARCIEIIETLLRKNEKVNEGDRPNQHVRTPDSLVGVQEAGAGALHARQHQNESPSAPTAQQPRRLPAYAPQPSPESPSSTMNSASRAPDFPQFSIQDMSGRGDLMPFSGFEAPFFDNGLPFFLNEPTWFDNEPPFFDGTSTILGPMPVQDSSLAMQGARP